MKSLKELRAALFAMYNHAKDHKSCPIAFDAFKVTFADELFAEARAALKASEANAAGGTLVLSSVQALTLKSRGKLMERINLNFRESADQLLKSMAGFEAIGAELTVVQPPPASPETENALRIALTRTDGIEESIVYAEVAVIAEGDTLFVLEPFTSEDKTGKVWSEMTAEERATFSAAGSIRQASSMPKYLMKRRARVEKVDLRHDNRTAWLEVHYVEIEAFDRSKEEEQALIAEFHPTSDAIGEASKNEEVALEAKGNDQGSEPEDELLREAQAINAGDLDHEDMHEGLGELGEDDLNTLSDEPANTDGEDLE